MPRGSERRKYLRISSVLPVEFVILDNQGNRMTPWLQGFTQDIGIGGICLMVNDLWWGFWDRFNFRGATLYLKVDFPFEKKSTFTKATVAWVKEERQKEFNQYLVGVEFQGIDLIKSANLYRYAAVKRSIPFAVGAALGLMAIFASFFFWKAEALRRANRDLIENYVSMAERSSTLDTTLQGQAQQRTFSQKRQNELQDKAEELEKQVAHWQQEYAALKEEKAEREAALRDEAGRKLEAVKDELASVQREREFLSQKDKVQEKAAQQIEKEIEALRRERAESSGQIAKQMYSWIKNRQDLGTGLVLSYEGDRALQNVSYTYDQALAAFVFLLYSDKKSAGQVLDFYLQKIEDNEPVYNSYYTTGQVQEYAVHSGPQAWLGLAALNYTSRTNDKKYLPIARYVRDYLVSMMDKEGGIKGGPDVEWYSTEHNLDAYAFFALYSQVADEREALYIADNIKQWLAKYSYTQYGPPVKRGRGDATIATDTYAWSISALGPANLLKLNMNPEAIMEFAVENCAVETTFNYNGRLFNVRGFDFAKYQNLARGGVISSEWTAQMILSFEILADYYKDKDPAKQVRYLQKALFYFNELQKMLITSPSKAGKDNPCLPYASADKVDTGHGWQTPNGSRTGSLAATAYFLTAYYGYNPFTGQYADNSLQKIYTQGFKSAAQ